MRITPKNLTLIADEYVLGLLDDADAAEVEAALDSDQALAEAVAQARDRFLPLDTAAEPTAVSPALWERIEAGLPGGSSVALKRSPAGATLAANDDGRTPFWRVLAFGSMAASLVLAVGLAWSLMRQAEPLVVAVLLNDAGEVQAVVEDFGNDTANVRLLADFVIPEDKTMQVWTLPSRDLGPVSIGLLEARRSATLLGPALPRPQETQLYEITLEQAGGSPTGRPTGPILAKGFARQMR
jgi:anti-sigma-K factor RskA